MRRFPSAISWSVLATYSTTYNPADGRKGLANYLIELNKERNKKFQVLILYFREVLRPATISTKKFTMLCTVKKQDD